MLQRAHGKAGIKKKQQKKHGLITHRRFMNGTCTDLSAFVFKMLF